MKRKVLMEGLFFGVVVFVTIGESLRLITHRDPKVIYDVLGPGFYVLFLGIALMVVSVVHVFMSYRKSPGTEGVASNKGIGLRAPLMSKTVVYMVGVFVFYVASISIFGYLWPTLIFLFLEFWLAGVKSWITNIILTLVITATFYFVFLYYCSMVFPRGIFY